MTTNTSGQSMSLGELFSVSPQALEPTIKVSLGEVPDGLDREKLQRWKSIEQSPQFAKLVSEHVCGFLTGSVAGVLAGAWHTYRELQEAGSETLADPALHSEVVLSDHEFSYDLNPSLDLLAGGFRLAEITFTITAQFALHALALSIRRGCVDAIRSGNADCSLCILCGGSTVFARKLAAVALPGIAPLTEPILIASSADTRAAIAS